MRKIKKLMTISSFWKECDEQFAGIEKFGRLRCAGHIIAMMKKNSYRIFVENLLGEGRLDDLEQCFSNYGPRTTSGPRGASLLSFKKDRRKNKIQINFVSYYS
jgi:hypothetical protein